VSASRRSLRFPASDAPSKRNLPHLRNAESEQRHDCASDQCRARVRESAGFLAAWIANSCRAQSNMPRCSQRAGTHLRDRLVLRSAELFDELRTRVRREVPTGPIKPPCRAKRLTSVSKFVSTFSRYSENRLYLRAIVVVDTRNHNPRVGGSSPSSGIAAGTRLSFARSVVPWRTGQVLDVVRGPEQPYRPITTSRTLASRFATSSGLAGAASEQPRSRDPDNDRHDRDGTPPMLPERVETVAALTA